MTPRPKAALTDRLSSLSDAIGDRSLIWFGIRAEDAASLLRLPQFAHSFGVTAPMRAARLESTTTLEGLTGHRVDLDTYDIDDDTRPAVTALRREVLHRLAARESVALCYRPSHFLSDILFAVSDRTLTLGLFKERQSAYEHKPWVETELSRRGIRSVPWRYVAEEHKGRLVRALDEGPVVLRPSRSSGGVGMTLVATRDELDGGWPGRADHLVGYAPFLGDAIPLNIGACVFANGQISVHPASVQLIGIPSCTNRRFGYCGNDFAAFARLPRAVHDEVDRMTRAVGRWLGEDGYLGAFGVDFLLDGETLYFGEVNARLQGSTAVSCAMARERGHSDIVLDHLTAFLGGARSENLTVGDWVAETAPVAQIVVHNTEAAPVRLTAASSLGSHDLRSTDVQLVPDPTVWVDPGAVLARAVIDRSVTTTGFALDSAAESAARAVIRAFAATQT